MNEQCRYNNSSLLDPCSDGERLRFSPTEGCSNFVMKKSKDGEKIGRAPKPGLDFPKSVAIDGVEGLGQVYE